MNIQNIFDRKLKIDKKTYMEKNINQSLFLKYLLLMQFYLEQIICLSKRTNSYVYYYLVEFQTLTFVHNVECKLTRLNIHTVL